MLTRQRLMMLAAYAASPDYQAEIAQIEAQIKRIDDHYAQLKIDMESRGEWFNSRIGRTPIIVDVPEAADEDYPAAAR